MNDHFRVDPVRNNEVTPHRFTLGRRESPLRTRSRVAAGIANDLPDGIDRAARAVDSGAARQKLAHLAELSGAAE